ncbi:MAG: hypothetical protein ABI599_15235 [Flavobacteriales bacterium]
MLLKGYIIALLLLIFWEDLRHRAVHWSLFAQLAICLGVHGVLSARNFVFWQDSAFNLIFLAVQFTGVFVYLVVRERRWVNPLKARIGAGDVLFMAISTLAFSAPDFALYVVSGLFFSLLAYAVLLLLHRRAERTVPMAGFMALYMGIWVAFDLTGVVGRLSSRLLITEWM